MFGLLTNLLPGLLGLGGKLIEDKDKRAEFAFKVQAMSHELALKMLEVKTYPWIDGLVKLSYASEQIVKGLFRPLGSFAALVFVAYCEANEIPLSGTVETVMVGLFPAWGASRYAEKKKKADDSVGDLGW